MVNGRGDKDIGAGIVKAERKEGGREVGREREKEGERKERRERKEKKRGGKKARNVRDKSRWV